MIAVITADTPTMTIITTRMTMVMTTITRMISHMNISTIIKTPGTIMPTAPLHRLKRAGR